MEEINKVTGGGGSDSLAFNHLFCHPEFISGSKNVRPRQQTLKPVQGDRVSGFTLAEVLITLAIIGVVAALTIPTVVRNYQKQETVTRLKKVYSALSNTTNLAIAEHGPIEGWDYGKDNTTQSTKNFVETYIIPYLKVSKVCGFSTDKVCNYPSKALSGVNTSTFQNPNYYTFALNDGTVISAVLSAGNTGWVDVVQVFFDISGSKKPNIWGKDIFVLVYLLKTEPPSNPRFVIDRLKVPREDILDASNQGNCNKEHNGYCCFAVIVKDGWQIKDDYPW